VVFCEAFGAHGILPEDYIYAKHPDFFAQRRRNFLTAGEEELKRLV
jgi:hypothetical protein